MNADDIFTIMRRARTKDVHLDRVITDGEYKEITQKDIIYKLTSPENINILKTGIYSTADPTRKSGISSLVVEERIKTYLQAWIDLGKFDKLLDHRKREIGVSSMATLVKSFNKEFVDTFAGDIIKYKDPTKVKSVVNPSGMYAQQVYTINTRNKKIPFYERAVFRRLHDRHMDFGEDETEAPFYKMDHNPHLTAKERKKTNKTKERDPTIERVGMSFRMMPKQPLESHASRLDFEPHEVKY